MKPTVGRIVHYYDRAGKLNAAIVLDVHEDYTVDLEVFGQTRLGETRWPTNVREHDNQGDDRNSWTWPPRVG